VNRTRMKKEGAFDFLDKPLRRATLLAAARNALRSAGTVQHQRRRSPDRHRRRSR